MSALTRRGTVYADAVVFDAERCPGCDGRCAVRFGRKPLWPLPGEVDAPSGTEVALSASASRLVGETVLLFGVPVVCVAIVAFAVETATQAAWPVAAALVGSVLAALLTRRLLLREPRTSLTVGPPQAREAPARAPGECQTRP